MHRFIIVGGGAGGLELATRLGDRFGSTDSKTAAESASHARRPQSDAYLEAAPA